MKVLFSLSKAGFEIDLELNLIPQRGDIISGVLLLTLLKQQYDKLYWPVDDSMQRFTFPVREVIWDYDQYNQNIYIWLGLDDEKYCKSQLLGEVH